VGAISQYVEEAGVPTVCISLVRPHTEKMKPPRALWVAFEFGRPMGPPDNSSFQRKVLLAALNLLEASGGPLLQDFPDDAPELPDEGKVLECPDNFYQFAADAIEPRDLGEALRREIVAMRPWYDTAVAGRKRTTLGISCLEPEALGGFIYSFVKGECPENPRKDLSIIYSLKSAVEDLKAYYAEGITFPPGQAGVSSRVFQDWFWDQTIAGKVILELKKNLAGESRQNDEHVRQLLSCSRGGCPPQRIVVTAAALLWFNRIFR
jgi:hypothetical protein